MLRFFTFASLLVTGIWLTDNNTWQSVLGGLLIFIAGGIMGEDDAKQKNKLTDHLRKESKL